MIDSNLKASSPHTSHITHYTHHHPLAYVCLTPYRLDGLQEVGPRWSFLKTTSVFGVGGCPFRLHRSSHSIQKLSAAAGSSLHRSELEETRRNYKEHAISAISKHIKMLKIFKYLWYQLRGWSFAPESLLLGLVPRASPPRSAGRASALVVLCN